MELAGPPEGPVDVPELVRRLAGETRLTPVWRNNLGGLTFAVGDPVVRYVKWAPQGVRLDLAAERERMEWAAGFAAVPPPLALEQDAEGTCLVTAALPGSSAVAPEWRRAPANAVRAIGRGLRALHDALPVDECPYDWSVGARLERRRQAPGLALAAELADAPAVDRLVVCHGDACAPNTLLDVAGNWVGHVDLGSLGVADRWADLAVATWSTEWNYGPHWSDLLLDAYGVDPDPERMVYYRLLWDAT